jgi:hypothetical protein
MPDFKSVQYLHDPMQVKLNKERSKVSVQKITADEIRELMHMINEHEMEVKGDPYLLLVVALRDEVNMKLHQMTYPTKQERTFQLSVAQAVALFVLLGEMDVPISAYGHMVYRDVYAQLHHVLLELDIKLREL